MKWIFEELAKDYILLNRFLKKPMKWV